MPESIEQFAVSDDGFTFPAEEVLTGRGFITGKSGSGKSNTASVVIEELLDRNLGLLIVDTDGEYRGLTETYDLLHVGGSSECDLSITSEDADQLTSYALDDRVPILLDVSTYHDEETTRDVIYEVVDALFVAEGEYRLPFLVLVEEAHEFLPQQGGRGGADLSNLLIRVAKRGRKRGLGICCLSQRPAAVDKDYITQCDWFVWHRLTWETDTDVVGRILGTEYAEAVQDLADGEAIVMTDWDESIETVQFRRKRTEDAGSTPSLADLELSPPDPEPAETPTSTPPPSDSDSSGSTTTETGPEKSTRAADAASSPDDVGDRDGKRPTTLTASPPSLRRRRERRETPADVDDPAWELAAMIVYVYDTIVWAHLAVVYAFERAIIRAVDRIAGTGRSSGRIRRPGRLEGLAYRVLAIAALCAAYATIALVTLSLWQF